MVKVLNPGADPDALIRREWADNLADHLGVLGVTRKELQHRLASVGIDVTHQGVSAWMNGVAAPRPHVQAAIAHVLNVPARSLFPLNWQGAA